MTQLTDIIEVQISRETTPVSRAGFNTPLFIASHSAFIERARSYGSLEAVAEDFNSLTNVYKAAVAMFGQELRPSQIVIGRKQISSFIVSIPVAAIGQQYTITVNGTDYTYTAITADGDEEIAAGIKGLYDINPLTGVTVTDNLDGTLTVASTINWSFSTSFTVISSALPSTESWVEALAAVESENSSWFGATIESHIDTDVLEFAAAIQGRKKIFGTSSSSVAVTTGVDTDILSQLKALGYDKTFLIYSANADTQFPEAGLMAYQLQEQPGSNTWAYKDIIGTTVSKLSTTASNNIQAKNGITFEEIGGARVTTEGKTVGGEYIDVIVFALWLEARMTERIWFRLANSKKIPYTQAGATIIEAEIRAQLAEGVRVGGIAEAPAPQVFVPNVLDIAPNLRATRMFEGITFEARLAGAIQKVKIRGVVTV